MDQSGDGLKREWKLLVEQLRTTRDELRMKIHLGSMEAKDRWRKIQPEVDHVLGEAKQASADSIARVRKEIERLRALRDDVDHNAHPPSA